MYHLCYIHKAGLYFCLLTIYAWLILRAATIQIDLMWMIHCAWMPSDPSYNTILYPYCERTILSRREPYRLQQHIWFISQNNIDRSTTYVFNTLFPEPRFHNGVNIWNLLSLLSTPSNWCSTLIIDDVTLRQQFEVNTEFWMSWTCERNNDFQVWQVWALFAKVWSGNRQQSSFSCWKEDFSWFHGLRWTEPWIWCRLRELDIAGHRWWTRLANVIWWFEARIWAEKYSMTKLELTASDWWMTKHQRFYVFWVPTAFQILLQSFDGLLGRNYLELGQTFAWWFIR